MVLLVEWLSAKYQSWGPEILLRWRWRNLWKVLWPRFGDSFAWHQSSWAELPCTYSSSFNLSLPGDPLQFLNLFCWKLSTPVNTAQSIKCSSILFTLDLKPSCPLCYDVPLGATFCFFTQPKLLTYFTICRAYLYYQASLSEKNILKKLG